MTRSVARITFALRDSLDIIQSLTFVRQKLVVEKNPLWDNAADIFGKKITTLEVEQGLCGVYRSRG